VVHAATSSSADMNTENPTDLGAFSISLNVADISASRDFYLPLSFSAIGGDEKQGCQTLRNDSCTLGLFQDARALQAQLKSQGVEIAQETGPDGAGPANIMLSDPDGNPVLIDQHVPRPSKR